MKFLSWNSLFITSFILLTSRVYADDPPCPPPYTICLKEDQRIKVTGAIKELDQIKSSSADVKVLDPIVVIGDWDGRVYVNGGDKKPIRMKIKLGSTIDRDMLVTLPVQVYYRQKPPDPIFRIRLKAQIGFLLPELIRSIRDKNLEAFIDGGLALDFFHIGIFNVSAYVGIRSLGGSLGLDITKNFGLYAGPVMSYEGLKLSSNSGIYFSFN